MALGTITVNTTKFGNNGQTLFFDLISVPGDAAYVNGTGTTGFDATFAAAVGDSREVVGVMAQDCSGYDIRYKPATGGTLTMYEEGADGGAADEVASGDYSTTTLNLLVFSK